MGNKIYMYCMYTKCMYNIDMIRSFANKETEKVYNQEYSKKLPENIQKVALRKLMMIDAAEKLSDLRIPPANHLEALSGDRIGQWSIRINDQWRIVFVPSEGGRYYDEVEIIDYH